MNRARLLPRAPAALLVFSTAVLLATAPAAAEDGRRHDAAPLNVENLHKKRHDIAAEMERLSEEKNDSAEDRDSRKLEGTLTSLRSLDALYVQRETWLADKQKLEAQLAAHKKELASLDKFKPDEPKPYSFLLLERLKDEQVSEKERQRALKSNLSSAEQLLKAAHDELNRVGRAPAASNQSPQGQPSEAAAPGQRELAAANLPGLVARAKVGAKQAEIEVLNLRLELCQVKQKQLAKKIEVIGKDVMFSQRDLDQQYGRLASQEADLKRQRREIESQFQEFDAIKKDVQGALAGRENSDQLKAPANEAWRIAADAIQSGVVILDRQIEDLASLRTLWKRRYAAASKSIARAQLSEWRDDADTLLDHFKDETRALDHLRESVHADMAHSENVENGDETASKWTDFEHARLRELGDLIEAALLDVKLAQRLAERFDDELVEKIKESQGPLDDVGNSLRLLLGMEVAGTEEKSVTVGKLLLLLVMVAAGIFLAQSLSRVVARYVLPRLGLSRGSGTAARTILFYALCLFWGVLTFQLLSIPLAAFAFVGGAAAIAIGFGSQDIMNNFMSGLILLSEQPIRVGDVIDLGSVEGIVQHIGMRSTRLRTQLNHELIVPNKSLLDEQVTNYTLSDNVVRRKVTMTIGRSVPIQEAMFKMLEVARSHPKVMESPAPVVLLKEVDNYYETSMFEVYFAMHLHNFMECAIVQSAILEQIAELFPISGADDSDKPADPQNEDAPNGAPRVKDLKKLNRAAIVKELKKAQARTRDA